MGSSQWRNTGTVAWTAGDGPGRPPAGPSHRLLAALAVALGTVFAGLTFTGTLCPEHRTWVHLMAGTAFVGAAVSVVGLLRRWSLAPFVTAGVCALGVGIGLVDAIHAPARGAALAVVFGLLALACLAAALMMARQAAWDRAVARSLQAAPTVAGTAASAPVTDPGASTAPVTDPGVATANEAGTATAPVTDLEAGAAVEVPTRS